MKRLYGVKIFIGGASVLSTIASSFTYAAPLIVRLSGSTAVASAAMVVGERAKAIIAARILFMATGAWLTVIAFGIQVLIWIFNKNELQTWCSLCPFGTAGTSNAAYKSMLEQASAMQKVLIEMGMIEDKTPKDYPKIYPTLEESINHD